MESRVASTVWHCGDWQLPGMVTAPDPVSGCNDAACTPPALLGWPDEGCAVDCATTGEERAVPAELWNLSCGLPLP
jgi:hypothetical protein